MTNAARAWLWPVVGAAGAIAGSPLLSVATGQGILYNLWLAVMLVIVWAGERLTRREVGFTVGDGMSYGAAFAYVAAIIGLVTLGAVAAHVIDLTNFSGATVARRLGLNLLVTFALTLVTEDGFFRGALWGSCERAGFSPAKTIIWTSVAFGLWHVAVPIIDPDFSQPLAKVPQYVLGSTAFGAGEKAGQLGVADHSLWDPERGYAGLALAVAAAVLLWIWIKPAGTRQPSQTPPA